MQATKTGHIGTELRIRLTTYDASENLADADSTPTITISYGEPEFDTETVSAASMTNSGTGTYDYWWDTSGLNADVYEAVANYVMDDHNDYRKCQIRIL